MAELSYTVYLELPRTVMLNMSEIRLRLWRNRIFRPLRYGIRGQGHINEAISMKVLSSTTSDIYPKLPSAHYTYLRPFYCFIVWIVAYFLHVSRRDSQHGMSISLYHYRRFRHFDCFCQLLCCLVAWLSWQLRTRTQAETCMNS